MRIGLLGDVHADDVMLARALHLLMKRRVDKILCTGDLADGPGSLDRCCQLLIEHEVHAVRGNHDRWLIEGMYRASGNATQPADIHQTTREYVAALPPTMTIATPAGPLLLCHGLGEDDLFRLPEATPQPEVAARLDDFVCTTDVKLVVNGHVHRAFARAWHDMVFVNAGTVSRRFGPAALVLDLAAGWVTCARFDLDDSAIGTTARTIWERRQLIAE